MKLFDFVIVKLTICLIVGIILGVWLEIPFYLIFTTVLLLIATLTIVYFISKKQFKRSIWFGIITYTTMISIGVLTVTIHDEHYSENHYTQLYDFKIETDQPIALTITEILKPNIYNNRYVARISTIDSKSTGGKILLNIQKDSSNKAFYVDDKMIIHGHLQNIQSPLNPNQFDYKAYLKNHYVYAQMYSNHKSILIVSNTKESIYGYADLVRQTINFKLQNYDFTSDEMAVINALLLGQRHDISKELYSDYANAGAIHILAISGLHVGIILFMLKFLLGFLPKFKHDLIIKTVIILTLLWSYAIIAGLSPSVMRATTMFSAIAIGMYLKRPYNIYNTLAISAFILLLFKPMFLFEVGFQLSYLAVIGIVAINPLLYEHLKTKYSLPNKMLMYLTVSISAQLGVLPLSFFYFHQFPGLFWLTNVVIIPILGVILGYGFFVFILALFNVSNNFLISFFGDIINWMNLFFKWTASQDLFIINNISINWLLVIGLYFIIISFTRLFMIKTYKRLIYALISICIFQTLIFGTKFKHESTNELVIFHKSRQTIIGQKTGRHLLLFQSLDSLSASQDYIIKNYQTGNFIRNVKQGSLRNVLSFQEHKLLVIDSFGIYSLPGFKPDYILLINSPKINLERLIDSLHPKLIIADGSNYKSYVEKWSETCRNRKLPFHNTYEKGAFIATN